MGSSGGVSGRAGGGGGGGEYVTDISKRKRGQGFLMSGTDGPLTRRTPTKVDREVVLCFPVVTEVSQHVIDIARQW